MTARPKSFNITQQMVWDAYQQVRKGGKAGGVDKQSMKEFEADLKNNLYKIWNRMASGSYFPPAVRAVPIPKKSGGERVLGVPTIGDRIAQMVVKQAIEPRIDPIFHPDSYGYRPGRSALQAVGVVRERCWRYNWVLEFDIKGLFDNIDHELLMKAVRQHVQEKWVLLYIERWLKAPMERDGQEIPRDKGTPQGGVISPLLANLFLHYTLDHWIQLHHPSIPIVRYADDGVVHARTQEEALELKEALRKRFAEVGLELHPEKTKVIYCKDDNRQGGEEKQVSFDFLGYTFRPRRTKTRAGKYFIGFGPEVSREACKTMRDKVRKWNLKNRSDKSIEELAEMVNATIRGWINYYGRYRKSVLYSVLHYINQALIRWAQRTLKRFRRSKNRVVKWMKEVAQRNPGLFTHWRLRSP